MGVLDSILQSSSSTSLLGVLVVLLIVYLISSSFLSQENKNEPPGPRPLPLLGNLLQLDLKRPYNTLTEKYGPVFTVYLGPKKVVVLAGYKTVKEALVNQADEFGERDSLAIFLYFSFASGQAFDTTQPINYAVSNIICSMVYGSRFEYDDPQFTSMVDRTTRRIQLVLTSMCKYLTAVQPVSTDDQMDQIMTEINLHLQESGSTNSHFHNDNLVITVLNLFGAGTETTSTTLRWGLMLMVKYPKIQDQVQEEISRVIGTRQVQVEDRKNLPFTDAVIHETQRLANIVPMALPHKTSEDVTFQGYFIKKGTTVYPLLTSVLYDESEWEKPYSFNPAHFLDKDGKFVKRDAFMPFSAGRRICLGESLARMELFLFFTSILQHFRFTPPPGVKEEDLDLTPQVGFTLSPSLHKICAVCRM
uniref:Cytochrome P450 2K1-like n=1 Tax=Sphaeramia orbicularis TaxID=375764 RepID=A0A673CHM4_9TELE